MGVLEIDRSPCFSGTHLEDGQLHIKRFRLFLATKRLPHEGERMSSYLSTESEAPQQISQRALAEIAHFGATLRGSAETWFNKLIIGEKNGINTCDELVKLFGERFKFDEDNQWRELGRLNRMQQKDDQCLIILLLPLQRCLPLQRQAPLQRSRGACCSIP